MKKNRTIKDIFKDTMKTWKDYVRELPDDELLQDKEQLEDYLVLHINKAIEQATKINEAELGAVAKEGMPNIPGMDMFK